VFYYFSSAPRLDISVPCTGVDDENNSRTFFALNTGAAFRLEDPLRSIKTYDFTLQDLNNPSSAFPASPVTHTAPQFGNVNGPAVSAHYNAMLVFDFYNNELKRNGIDDKGMVLESVVNVYYSPNNPQPHPFWGNAVWYNKRMWYGQRNDASGKRISYARYLDVIGHELTHGVTETTSNLVYRDLSGALNESFSDIFGIIIKNWFPSCPNPIASWDWEMGPGLGAGGKAIRNFANPSLCGQPDHFSQYVPMTADSGGVHVYSGIHNLAVYKVLTSKRPDGTDIFPPAEVAYLYYITLTRLTRMSDFSDCKRTLLSVAATRYSADPLVRVEKQDAIKAAYNAVGIV
jgi:Zn-dependent metalloprotease